jgi:hypothetical protein
MIPKGKCVDGSAMETHCVIEAKIDIGNNSIIYGLQLFNKQVDIPCHGILGCDFLQRPSANICYETRTVTNGELRDGG